MKVQNWFILIGMLVIPIGIVVMFLQLDYLITRIISGSGFILVTIGTGLWLIQELTGKEIHFHSNVQESKN